MDRYTAQTMLTNALTPKEIIEVALAEHEISSGTSCIISQVLLLPADLPVHHDTFTARLIGQLENPHTVSHAHGPILMTDSTL